jgi:hypothetical protein
MIRHRRVGVEGHLVRPHQLAQIGQQDREFLGCREGELPVVAAGHHVHRAAGRVESGGRGIRTRGTGPSRSSTRGYAFMPFLPALPLAEIEIRFEGNQRVSLPKVSGTFLFSNVPAKMGVPWSLTHSGRASSEDRTLPQLSEARSSLPRAAMQGSYWQSSSHEGPLPHHLNPSMPGYTCGRAKYLFGAGPRSAAETASRSPDTIPSSSSEQWRGDACPPPPGPLVALAAARQLPHYSTGAEPERGRVMWNTIFILGWWLVYGVLALFWAWWTDRERERFANGDSRHLE